MSIIFLKIKLWIRRNVFKDHGINLDEMLRLGLFTKEEIINAMKNISNK